MHGPGGHGDRAGHIAGRRHRAIPGDLAEDAPDRDEPHTLVLFSRTSDPSEAPPLTAEVDRSACSAMPRGSGWDRR